MSVLEKGATSEEWGTFDLLLGLGEYLLPVVSDQSVQISPDSKMAAVGKTPSVINRKGFAAGFPDWTNHVASDADIARWSKDARLGICLQTKRVRALDIDVPDWGEALAIQAFLAERLSPSGEGIPIRYREDSTKFLILIDLPGDYTKRSFKTKHGLVEFLATGQQCIVAGTHTGGARYQWKNLDSIPEVTPEEFEGLWSALVETFAIEAPQEDRPRQNALKNAMLADPTSNYLIENDWVLSQERDGRLHIRCPFESEHTSAGSESATTYFPANTGGYVFGHFDCKHAHCAHRSDQDFKDAIGFEDIEFMDLTDVEQPEEEAAPGRYRVVHASEFTTRKSGGYHIKGLIPRGELVMIFGPSQSGKSFQALDLSMAIARGVDEWRGHRVKKGRVAYLIAEGVAGFSDRLKAYREYYGIELEEADMYVIPATPNFLNAKDVKDLIAAVKIVQPEVIVIDTWAQVTAGGDENSGEDMGKALSHCKALHYATGATPIIIHHSGKDGSKGARGWSGVHGAADAILDINRAGDDRVMSVVKMKDGVEGLEFGFKLNVVNLGEDEDGDPITSCVVVDHTVTLKEVSVGKNERVMRRVVGDLVGLVGIQPDVNTVLEQYASELPPETDPNKRDRRRELASRVYKNCIKKGALYERDGRVYIDEEDE